jgi:periplasmic protein TonB
MRGPLFISLGLHVVMGLAMVWASGANTMTRSALPQATVVKLIRPKGLPMPISEIKPGKGESEPETAPPMKIPTKKAKDKKAPVVTETKKPDVKKSAVIKKSTSTLPEGLGKELTGKAGTLGVSGEGFEYDFYLAVVQSKIEQNFRPPPGIRGQMLSTVAFTIQKNGMVEGVGLYKPSGNLLIDQAAERAIRAAGPFPPLPPQYDKGRLDIYFEFAVNPSAR